MKSMLLLSFYFHSAQQGNAGFVVDFASHQTRAAILTLLQEQLTAGDKVWLQVLGSVTVALFVCVVALEYCIF